MRRLACAIILISTVVLWGCGGSSPNNQPITSGITRRAFISNQFANQVDIVNAVDDSFRGNRILTDAGPTVMAMSPDKTVTLAFATGSNRLVVIDNKLESVLSTLTAGDDSISFFYLPDNKTIYIAIRNLGQVIKWDTSNTTTPTTTLSVPNAYRMVRSPDGKVILVFPDDASDTVYAIDTTVSPPTVSMVGGAAGLFDRPVWAVFSGDNSKAWVLNCGPECGGATASIQVVTFPGAALSGAPVPVPGGATHGLLSNNTLYVAGTPPANPCTFDGSVNCGFLTKLDVSGAPSVTGSFEISDGYHSHMLMAASSRLFIGAERTCAAIAPNGCLSIFNTASSTVSIKPPCGPSCNSLNDITGMTNITGRSVVYVIEGGEVHIYDPATDSLQSKQVDTVGRSYDVVSPD